MSGQSRANGRLGLALAALALAWLLAPLWATPQQLRDHSVALWASLQGTFGPGVGAAVQHLAVRAAQGVASSAVEAGLREATHGERGRAQARRQFAEPGEWLAQASDSYLVGVWQQLQGTVLRLLAAATWLVLLMPLLLAALADGFWARKRAARRLEPPSLLAFALARHAAALLLLSLGAWVVWPALDDAASLSWWVLAMAVALRQGVRHVQVGG